MGTPPPNFRIGFESQIADMPPQHQMAIKTLWNNVTDLQTAIPLLKSQIDTKQTASKSSSGTSSTSGSTVTQASVNAAIAAATISIEQSILAAFPGGVNNQTGVTTYSTLESDNGKLIILSDASPIAVSLSVTSSIPGITYPWYATIDNAGAGTATLTPSSGQINGGSTATIPGSSYGVLFYDGINFWLVTAAAAGSGVTQLLAGVGISLSPAGGTGVVTVSLIHPVTIADGGTGTGSTLTGLVRGSASAMTAAEISGDATTSGSNALTLATVNSNVGTFINATVTVNGKGLVTAAANGTAPYSLGGNLTNANVTLGAGAGTGASLTLISGTDGNHTIAIMTGTAPSIGGIVATVTFTASRANAAPIIFPAGSGTGWNVYSSLAQIPFIYTWSGTMYVISAGATALTATTAYQFNISCP